MKIRPVGAELFHADGRTYMTNLAVVFRSFPNASKNADSSILWEAKHAHMSYPITENEKHCKFSLPEVMVITRIYFPNLTAWSVTVSIGPIYTRPVERQGK
jgi:hypothetical protein